MNKYFRIGPLYAAIQTPIDFPWTAEAAVFRVDGIPEDQDPSVYTLEFVDEFTPLYGQVLHRDGQMMVMDTGGSESRIYFLSSGEPFALSTRTAPGSYRIRIDSRARGALKWDRTLLGLLSLEHECLRRHSFLLHASFVIHDGGAVVFTAPSGTGKSTQADLWAAHAGARIINGDRTLLFQEGGQWHACGFPVCGSSPHCLNQSAPVKALISLEQAPENRPAILGPAQAIRRIYSQAFVNRWDPGDCRQVFDMLADLALAGRVYHYPCTKEPEAVSCLLQAISGHDLRKQEQ